MLKTKDIISLLTLAIGIASIAYGLFLYLDSGSSFENSKIVDGSVTNYVKTAENTNVPVIEYTADSVIYTLVYNETIGTYPKENRVKIRYNFNNPKEAEIYESYIEFGIPMSIITIGIIILLFGGTMYYFSSKSK